MASAAPQKSPALRSAERATNDILRRVPPNNIEAEQAVLGGILLRNEVFNTLADMLKAQDFYLPAHAVIFNAFSELYRKGAPIDLVSTASYLNDAKQLENAGGAVYLAELTGKVLASANAEYYAGIVRDKAQQRALIEACSNIISNCFDATIPVSDLLDESEQAVFAVAERTTGKDFQDTKGLLDIVFETLQKRMEKKSSVTGVTTGYLQLDRKTAGLQPSDLIIVAARPSMGKTAFALNMALRAAVQDNKKVAVFSLEMSAEQLMSRMLGAWAKVDLSNLRRGFLNDEEWSRLFASSDVLRQAPVFIDDTPALSPMELRARVRRLKARSGVDLVVIDYLQLMRASKRTDSREQEISEISRSLKALAKEMNIPVVALSQLNRKLEERGDKRPLLSDLRESGAIEQDADVILFIYRDEVYNKKEDNPNRGKAEIIIGKQRNGPIGTVELVFLPQYTAFEDLDIMASPSEDGNML